MTEPGGSDEPRAAETWLPNLVGGVSIWKLAADLNQEKFFGGRLLEPEVEGAESLPTRVVWHVERLVPLAEARAAHGADVDTAVRDFLGCVERVGKELASPQSGFRKFREAFSVPSLEGEGARSYFYDPSSKKLLVANWGASPRSIAGHGELVFGYEKFDRLVAAGRANLGAAAAVGGAAVAGAAVAAAAPATAAAAASPADAAATDAQKKADEEKKKKEEDEKKKKAEEKKPLWVWILAVLVGVAAVFALLMLLRACREPTETGGADAGPDAATDAGADADPDAATDAATDADPDAAADAATDADPDAAADAATDAAADAEADAAADAGADAQADAAADAGGGEGDGTGETKVGGDGTGSGDIFIVPGGSGPGTGGPPVQAVGIPFRSHFQPGATSWRITRGARHLNRQLKPRMNRGSFEVFLEPGSSFSDLQVEWKDAAGKWHVH